MLYLSIKENANDAHQSNYNQIYSLIQMIRENKEDIIYKSSIPRLKQTKLRGIQAFKEVIKKLTQSSKLKFDEATKNLWLNCFKMVYNFNSHSLNLNNVNCITFDKSITIDQIKEKSNLEEVVLGESEPNGFEHTDEFIDTIFQYIMAEKLKPKDLIKLVNKIFNELC